MSEPRTLFDKLWEKHVVSSPTDDQPAILYIDLHLVHEVTSPQAFDELRRRGISLRCPDLTIATMDHSIPTNFEKGKPVYLNESARDQVEVLRKNCEEFGVTLYAIGSSEQGIVHVIGPELGLTRPGRTIVCGDSHTSTHGAFGSLAFGIGTTEVAHVFATQCLLQRKPKTFEVRLDGELAKGVTAKDVILYVIRHVGVDGGRGYVIEYRGTCIQSLSMEERMTVCNMSIEAGARAGIIAPDDTTFSYLAGREFSPKGAAWDDAVADWRALVTDDEARFDKTVVLDASVIEPMVTYGTNPSMSVAIGDSIPSDLTGTEDEQALAYMKMSRGDVIVGTPVDIVFIGSCTNARIEDLRLAASIMQGRKVADGVRVLVVPGSQEVKRLATNEGLDLVFKEAGAEWHEPGCSMCLGMNGDTVGPGQLAVSTSNRNFEGRQGMGARTVLASPLTAAATAVSGVIADARQFIGG